MTTVLDMAAIKGRQQKTWASGDYSAVGARIHPMAELLVQAADLPAGARVLDVACGSGNAALAAARCGCRVTGIDYVPGLLDRARTRSVAEELPIELDRGDAEALPYPDGSFDAVLSVVGVMFAPDQERAAAELARVCRPDGRIALAAWTPDGFIGQMFRTVGRHVPPPAGALAGRVGDRGTTARASRQVGVGADLDAAGVRVPVHRPGGLRRVLPGQLRADVHRVRRPRRRRPRRPVRRPGRAGPPARLVDERDLADPGDLPGDPGHPLTQTGRVPPRLTIFIVNWELTLARPGSSASSFM